MINPNTETLRQICASFFVDELEQREQLIKKLEDCLDLVAAINSLNEVCKTGEITEWDEFEKELDAME